MQRIDLAVAAVLIDDGAVLRAGRAEVVGIGAKSDRCRQPVELLAQCDIAGQQIIWRRRDGIGWRIQRADAFVQVRDLEIGENGEIMGDIEPGIALEARIGLVEARILFIDGRLRIQLQIDSMPFPQRMGAQARLEHCSQVRAFLRVRRKHVAVEEAAANQRRIEHPGAGADTDRLIAGLLPGLHRHVLRRNFLAALRIGQVGLRGRLEDPLCVPRRSHFLFGPGNGLCIGGRAQSKQDRDHRCRPDDQSAMIVSLRRARVFSTCSNRHQPRSCEPRTHHSFSCGRFPKRLTKRSIR